MRALVVGIDGSVGAALATALAADGWSVAGTSRRGRPDALPLDLAGGLGEADRLPAADAVFLCAAMTRQAECRADPVRAARINRDAPVRLARAAAGGGGRLILLSTSAVFDGRVPRRPAEDAPCPLNEYGRLKAEAEAGVLAEGGTVVRLTKILHRGLPLFRDWSERLGRKEPVEAFADLFLAPIPLDHAVDGLIRIGRSAAGGIFQLSATHDIAYAEAARHIARGLGVPEDLVRDATAAAAGIPAADRPASTSLDAGRAARLFNLPPPDPYGAIDRVYGLDSRENG